MKETPSNNTSRGTTKESVFISWYEAYSDEIFRFAIVRTRDREKALDITQETFTKLWDYMQKKDIEHPRGILFKIARNLIIDESRKASGSTLSLDQLMGEQEEGYPRHEPAAPKSDIPQGTGVELERVMLAIETLEPNHREIITYRFLHDLSVDEISNLLDISKNSVSVRIHRGLEALKKLLGDHDTFKDIT